MNEEQKNQTLSPLLKDNQNVEDDGTIQFHLQNPNWHLKLIGWQKQLLKWKLAKELK